MKRITKILAFIGVVAFMQSCYYDNPPELVPFDCDEVSYVTHVQPIWDAKCATVGCHDGSREPDMTAELGYAAIIGGGFVNTAVPDESILLKTVTFEQNPMPPGGPKISDSEIEIIRCWISEGALNN